MLPVLRSLSEGGCAFAFELAQRFSTFYAAHHILSEPNAPLRGARLTLCTLTLTTRTRVLSLLGLDVPERM
ncbi:MAG: hypothetical protein KBA31_02465 [Alphaproteobacteria bacterium]|nr:hypothetical protein [Alphaproteobacteria bacterium]